MIRYKSGGVINHNLSTQGYCLTLLCIIFCAVLSGSNIAFAQNNPNSNSHIKYINPIYIQISAKGINHISFGPLVATAITGDISEYSASLSANGSELFVTSKLSSGNNIPLSVTIAGGRVIDLNLAVVDSQLPKIVKIDLGKMQYSTSQIMQDEVKQMINTMRIGVVNKYYVTEHTRSTIKKVSKLIKTNVADSASLSVTELSTYRFDNLVGTQLEIKNISKKEVVLNAYLLARDLKGVVAIAVDNKKLKQGQSTKAYLVLKQGISI